MGGKSWRKENRRDTYATGERSNRGDLIRSLKKVGIVRKNAKQETMPQGLTSLVNLNNKVLKKKLL